MSDSSQFPQLGPRKRLHFCTGAPYDEASRDLANGYSNTKLWKVEDVMEPGDFILTSVATAPRMFVALDVVLQRFDPDTDDWMICDDPTGVKFKSGILVDAVENSYGWELPTHGMLGTVEARKLLVHLEAEHQRDIPWFIPGRWDELN